MVFFRSSAISLLFVAVAVNGQIPTVCVTPTALSTKTCCPESPDNNLICGGPTRGICRNISETFCYPDASLTPQQLNGIASPKTVDIVGALNNSTTETRHLWPTKFFTRTCACIGNWFGIDCSECKWGYVRSTSSGNCVKTQPLVRRNYLNLARSEQQKLISAFAKAKLTKSRYSVITREPDRSKGERLSVDDFVTNASAFDVFAWLHYYSAKDSQATPQIDFAHERSAFLTWHRWYLLFVDREMQYVTGDNTFTLPYWDWSDKQTRARMFDGTTYAGTACRLCGQFAHFDIKCSKTLQRLYNKPTAPLCSKKDFWEKPALVARNVSGTDWPGWKNTSFALHVRDFPSTTDVFYALNLGNVYDAYPFDKSDSNNASFRNLLEGFASLPNKTYCSGNSTVHELHNDVHIFIGNTMAAVPASTNDPIFWLHHSNVDRIFEMWIRSKGANSTWFQPQRGGAPGHNAKDCLVPFFHLAKNEDLLTRSTDFGYVYDNVIPPSGPTPPSDPNELNMCRFSSDNPATSDIYSCDCPPELTSQTATVPSTSASSMAALSFGLLLGLLFLLSSFAFFA